MFGYRILKPLKFLPFISTEKTSDCPSALTANRKVNRWELATLRGVQARERTRAPHIPASAAPAEARQPASAGVAKIFCLLAEKLSGAHCQFRWRCNARRLLRLCLFRCWGRQKSYPIRFSFRYRTTINRDRSPLI